MPPDLDARRRRRAAWTKLAFLVAVTAAVALIVSDIVSGLLVQVFPT